MRRTFKSSFSLGLLLCSLLLNAQEADTVKARNSISLGFDITGPVLYALDNTKYSYEGYLSYRLNYKYFIVCEPGYSEYNYEQYNYEYYNKGWFVRVGVDIGMLEPVASKINHFAGIGLRYGLSVFEQETPSISIDNYWGTVNTSIPKSSVHAHFLELQGGVKAELARNLLIGWSVKLRALIYSSGRNEETAAYIPGLGGTDASFIPAISYYIIYRIPIGSSPVE